jgi:phosphoribosylglycinamide formyltransferase-1
VHLVDEGLDSGPIVAQEAVPVLPRDTPETLAARILEVEHRLYPRAVRLLLDGRCRVEGRRVIVEGQ